MAPKSTSVTGRFPPKQTTVKGSFPTVGAARLARMAATAEAAKARWAALEREEADRKMKELDDMCGLNTVARMSLAPQNVNLAQHTCMSECGQH